MCIDSILITLFRRATVYRAYRTAAGSEGGNAATPGVYFACDDDTPSTSSSAMTVVTAESSVPDHLDLCCGSSEKFITVCESSATTTRDGDVVCMDQTVYRQLLSDVDGYKSLLLQLRRHLTTQDAFDPDAGNEDPQPPLKSLNALLEDNARLVQQVSTLVKLIDEKDKTISSLQHQLTRLTEVNRARADLHSLINCDCSDGDCKMKKLAAYDEMNRGSPALDVTAINEHTSTTTKNNTRTDHDNNARRIRSLLVVNNSCSLHDDDDVVVSTNLVTTDDKWHHASIAAVEYDNETSTRPHYNREHPAADDDVLTGRQQSCESAAGELIDISIFDYNISAQPSADLDNDAMLLFSVGDMFGAAIEAENNNYEPQQQQKQQQQSVAGD